ncbi:MAG: segregation and condensation protein A [Candidatus Omnitrophota bacterium]
MTYKAKIDIFEGPLDLLLFLVKKEKIDIYDIPISRITEQYLEYLELMKMLDLDIAGEFLVMAATLMHIKSKMLLPPDEENVFEEEEEDPREELVRRLLEYKKYKEAAARLQEMYDSGRKIFVHKGTGDREKIVTDDGSEYFEASLFDLIGAFKKVLSEVSKETFHKAVKDKFTVRDKIHAIYHVLAQQPKAYFTSLFKDVRNKDEIIVTFLAVLELIKLREIVIVQKDFFGEIEIIRNPELVKSES